MGLWSRWKRRQPATPEAIFGASLIFAHQRGIGITLGTPPQITDWAERGGGSRTASNIFSLGPDDTADGPDFVAASGHYLAIADHASLDVTTAACWGLKIIPDLVTGNRVPLARGASAAGPWSFQTNGTAMRWHAGNPGVAFGEGGTLSAGAATYFLMIYDGGATGSAARAIMRQDGAGLTLSFPTGAIPATLGATADEVWYGKYTDAAQPFDGHVQAAFFANRIPTAGEIPALETYLAGA